MEDISPQEERPCKVEPDPSWTEQEKWVWEKVCADEVANFNKKEGKKLDPKKSEEWTETRVLSPEFLQTILLEEPYCEAIHRKGVRIIGAWIKEPLDLSYGVITFQLCFQESLFESKVSLRDTRVAYLISFIGSNFNSWLDMEGMDIKGPVFMRNGAEFRGVVLSSARIDDQLDMTGSKFNGKLDMDKLKVESSLFMSGGAEFKEVVLSSARIGDQLDMTGSKFNGKLNMASLKVESHLFMRNGAEFREVVLSSARIGGQLSMIGSKFRGKLNMDSLEVRSSLFMRGGSEFNEVNLYRARIGDQLSMIGSMFNGKLDMNSLEVRSGLFMRGGSEFQDVDLVSARIGGELHMMGSTFHGELNMNSLKVDGYLHMKEGAEFKARVILPYAQVDENLEMDGSKFRGKLNMASLEVKSHLFMRGGAEFEEVVLLGARIGGDLQIFDSKFSDFNLTGAKVEGEFNLGAKFKKAPGLGKAPKWENGAKLILRNTEIGALQDLQNSWEVDIDLTGFTYSRLGGFGVDPEKSMANRNISWLKKWLEKQKDYSPQPYEQLAKVLREEGYKKKARDILFESKERERKEAYGTWLNRFNLFLQWIFVGYGFRYLRTFFWVLGLTLFGAFMLWITEQSDSVFTTNPDRISYSLDMILPIIKLNEAHYKIPLFGFAKYYFYFHQLMGFVLASYIVAGLSGITKK